VFKRRFDQFFFQPFFSGFDFKRLGQLREYLPVSMQGSGAGDHGGVAFVGKLFKLFLEDAFANAGRPHNHRETALLRMDVDQVEDLFLLGQ